MNSRLIEETARAWQMESSDITKLVSWVEYNVPPYNQAFVFGRLLRKKRESRLRCHCNRKIRSVCKLSLLNSNEQQRLL